MSRDATHGRRPVSETGVEPSNTIVGRRFGRLLVVSRAIRCPGSYYAVCQCDCGGQPIQVKYSSLRERTSCGCDRAVQMALYDGELLPIKEIARRACRSVDTIREHILRGKPLTFTPKAAIGRRWGMLTVLRADRTTKGLRYWVRCDCGIERWAFSSSLSIGATTSCGCDEPQRSRSARLLGQTFGRLCVIGETDRRTARGVRYWICRCECGTEKQVLASNLTSSLVKSCGCLRACAARRRGKHTRDGPRAYDLTGNVFADLTVVALARRTKAGAVWRCACTCGRERMVPGHDLRKARAIDCGRCSRKKRGERMIEHMGTMKPLSVIAAELGCTRNWLYQALRSGKAIGDIGRRHSNRAEAGVSLFGVMTTIHQLSAVSGLKYGTVCFRLRGGLTPEQIVSRPRAPGVSYKTGRIHNQYSDHGSSAEQPGNVQLMQVPP